MVPDQQFDPLLKYLAGSTGTHGEQRSEEERASLSWKFNNREYRLWKRIGIIGRSPTSVRYRWDGCLGS